MGAFHERVVGLWDCGVGKRVGWAGDCGYRESYMDGYTVGELCTMRIE